MTMQNVINLNGTVCNIVQRNALMYTLERNGHKARYYPHSNMLVYRDHTGKFIAQKVK